MANQLKNRNFLDDYEKILIQGLIPGAERKGNEFLCLSDGYVEARFIETNLLVRERLLATLFFNGK